MRNYIVAACGALLLIGCSDPSTPAPSAVAAPKPPAEDPAVWDLARKIKPRVESYEDARKFTDLAWQVAREADPKVDSPAKVVSLVGFADLLDLAQKSCTALDGARAREFARDVTRQTWSDKQAGQAYAVLAQVEVNDCAAASNNVTELANHVRAAHALSSSARQHDPHSAYVWLVHAETCRKMWVLTGSASITTTSVSPPGSRSSSMRGTAR